MLKNKLNISFPVCKKKLKLYETPCCPADSILQIAKITKKKNNKIIDIFWVCYKIDTNKFFLNKIF